VNLAEKNFKVWSNQPFDKETTKEVYRLKEKLDRSEFNDIFHKDLEFGTGGMRGIMGIGPNRINKYSLGKTTQGICNFINDLKIKEPKVIIGYDSRKNGKYLCDVVSDIFNANNIRTYVFDEIKPTPIVSFGVRNLSCICGIVITASHNPPEYNGYKVYWSDGGQIVPPIDKKLMSSISRTNYADINFQTNKNLKLTNYNEIEKEYFKELGDYLKKIDIKKEKKKLKVVFTPIHGTSYKMIPSLLEDYGFEYKTVESQMIPDGNFPTVISPNPEEAEALSIGISLAKKLNYDIVVGTDPDSDRFGIAIRQNNEFILLNGNQTMVLMLDYLLKKNINHKNSFIASTVVSTPMIEKIAKLNNVEIMLSLTGFKWIGKMINDFPEKDFVAGGEESYGFLFGDFVRDKDAIASSLLICEILNEVKEKNKSFLNQLIDCYIKYGFYKEKLVTKKLTGLDGRKKINSIIDNIRKNPPKKIGNSNVLIVEDYLLGKKFNFKTKKSEKIKLPQSNLIILKCEDKTSVCLRPSGTEPKIKYYFSVSASLKSAKNYIKVNNDLELKLNELIKDIV
jgi:phosphoglucomutase|tara:strand:+ start:1909 stop:3603 length:1695 start_codon:yes stop_codon:yes gene_type:complete